MPFDRLGNPRPNVPIGGRHGDVIISINGIPVEYFAGLSAIRELLRREPGTSYEFEVVRDGQTEHISVELAKLLE